MDRTKKRLPVAQAKRRRPRKVEYPTYEQAIEIARQRRLEKPRTYEQKTETEVEKELAEYKTRGYWKYTQLPRKLKKMFRAETFEQFLRRDLSGLHPDADPRDKRLFKELKRQRERQGTE
jgi:aspartyl/asparaginyl-tRNA synthetase